LYRGKIDKFGLRFLHQTQTSKFRQKGLEQQFLENWFTVGEDKLIKQTMK